MPTPESVNPEKFKVIKVLYNHDDFSISQGVWTPDNTRQIAMRWNEGYDGNGYPKAWGHPQWFIISEDLSRLFLSVLLNSNHISSVQYEDILEALKDY